MWVTYTKKYGGGHQLDRLPDTYMSLSFHEDELSALRWANDNGAKVVEVFSGDTIEVAIERNAQ